MFKHKHRYNRVLPRDLFNEAKLLKCMGQLALAIHDGRDIGGYVLPAHILHELEDDEFRIVQNQDDGSLSIETLRVLLRGYPLHFYSVYNSREPYPLFCLVQHPEYYNDVPVFGDEGLLTGEFQELLEKLDEVLKAESVGAEKSIPQTKKQDDDWD